MKKIEKTAGDFAKKSRSQKNPEALILEKPDIHTGDELESLANTLVSMSENMKEYVEDLLASAIEMEDMRQEMTKMSDIALKDALTGTKNKAAYDKAKNRLDWDILNQIASFGILMIDLNYLKRINDTYGHEKGDSYIKNMCQMVCDIFTHSPVYRIGGDEFVVIMHGSDYARREELMADLTKLVEENQKKGEIVIASGISEYIATGEKRDARIETVFERADSAMYVEKKRLKGIRE